LEKNVPDFADGPVAVVGGRFDQQSHASGSVPFEDHLLDLFALQLAGAAHDGAPDVVGRHAGGLGGQDGGTQARVGIGVTAVAGGDGDFLDKAREEPSALGVLGSLLVFDGRPFGMA